MCAFTMLIIESLTKEIGTYFLSLSSSSFVSSSSWHFSEAVCTDICGISESGTKQTGNVDFVVLQCTNSISLRSSIFKWGGTCTLWNWRINFMFSTFTLLSARESWFLCWETICLMMSVLLALRGLYISSLIYLDYSILILVVQTLTSTGFPFFLNKGLGPTQVDFPLFQRPFYVYQPFL